MKLLAMMSLLAACGGAARDAAPPRPQPAPAAAGPCDRAAALMIDSVPFTPALPPAEVQAWRLRLVTAVATSCAEDDWPREALDCFAAADPTSSSECVAKIGQDDVAAAHRRLDPLVEKVLAQLKTPEGDPVTMSRCEAYDAELARLLACERIPEWVRHEEKKHRGLLSLVFEPSDDVAVPPEARADARANAEGICSMQVKRLHQRRALAGCTN